MCYYFVDSGSIDSNVNKIIFLHTGCAVGSPDPRIPGAAVGLPNVSKTLLSGVIAKVHCCGIEIHCAAGSKHPRNTSCWTAP